MRSVGYVSPTGGVVGDRRTALTAHALTMIAAPRNTALVTRRPRSCISLKFRTWWRRDFERYRQPAAGAGSRRAERTLDETVSRLLSALAAYPAIVASPAFIDLRERLTRADDWLASTRRTYNDAVHHARDITDVIPAPVARRLGLPPPPAAFEPGSLPDAGWVPPAVRCAGGRAHGDGHRECQRHRIAHNLPGVVPPDALRSVRDRPGRDYAGVVGLPSPQTQVHSPAPAGTVRLVVWRQQTAAGLPTELAQLHGSRSGLLHSWADEHHLRVDDWGETDSPRHAEFVELILPLAQTVLAAAVGVLVKEYVDRFWP